MAPDAIFEYGNMLAMAGWIILVFLPRRYGLIVAPRFLIPAILSFFYAPLALSNFFTAEGGFSSIADVRALFQNDAMLTAGWLHYLAFDLFVGSWIATESDRIGVSRIIQSVFLLATFMFGPVGFLLFLLTRTMMTGAVARATGAPK